MNSNNTIPSISTPSIIPIDNSNGNVLLLTQVGGTFSTLSIAIQTKLADTEEWVNLACINNTNLSINSSIAAKGIYETIIDGISELRINIIEIVGTVTVSYLVANNTTSSVDIIARALASKNGGGGGSSVDIVQTTGSNPNVVMSQYATTLALNQKQSTLQFDSVPTEDSQNPVTSGGVFESEKDIKELIAKKTTVTSNNEEVSTFNADTKLNVPIFESFTISSWTELVNNSIFTYSATVTANTNIGENAIVTLINNQALLFAEHGFNILSINGQNITIGSVGQPTEAVTLTVGVIN